MKTIIMFLLFFGFHCSYIFAYSLDVTDNRELDSLKKALCIAQQDTTRIALRYYIGLKEAISSVSYWDSILTDARKYHLPLYECRALIMKGDAYNAQKECSKSVECLTQSLLIADRMGLKRDKLPLYANLATAYYELSDIGKALDINYKGLKIAEDLKDKKFATAFHAAKGAYYLSLGEANKALKIHLECLKAYREIGYNLGIAGTLLDVGSDYDALNDQVHAAQYYLACKKYANEFGANKYTVQILNSIGVAYRTKNMPDSAKVYLSKAYKLSLAIHSKLCITSSLAAMAGYNYSNGNNKLAVKQALQALEIARSIKFTRQIPSLLWTLKSAHQKDGQYKEALQAYELLNAMKDSIANEQTRNKASEKEFEQTFEQKEHENKLLAQQNQIQTLQLKKNKFLMFGMGGTVLLAVILSYLFILQSKLNAHHQRVQLEQKLLRSQMNPHFIYNSLQAIQNYVLNHDALEAVKYLSSFASLTRNVLENSRMDFIPLKKEISLLNNYLKLQKLRFGTRFDYEISVDEQIDAERLTIPPMLAQPFIENAILHGMEGIESGGRINVAYYVNGNELMMEITDNGHGMKQGNLKGKEHQSLAMEITSERVMLMNKKNRRKTNCIITDAYPLHPDRNGVKVTFSLPLLYAA